jgi:hypothetical protein
MQNEQVTTYIQNSPEEQRELMFKIRDLIHEIVPNVVEEFKWSRPIFKVKKHFSYLLSTKNYVNLGFVNFQKLNDPLNLLEGTGKDMRHIKLKSLEELNESQLREWFKVITQSEE